MTERYQLTGPSDVILKASVAVSFELVCKFDVICEDQIVGDLGADNENAGMISTVRIYSV